MAAPVLSSVTHNSALRLNSGLPDEVERLTQKAVNSRSSSYNRRGSSTNLSATNGNGKPRGSSPPATGEASTMAAALGSSGEGMLMDRYRSASRISLRPSYETFSMANGEASRASSNPDSVAAQAVPVTAIGKVNVTDPWGTAWGMDSPYDASVAYASNPNRITMRQSAIFGSGLTLAALAGPGHAHPYSSSPLGSNGIGSGNMASTSSGQLHPHAAAVSPAPSSFSSISGSQTSSGHANVWSEVSSTRSFNGVLGPSAPWINDVNNKKRSVSFQGDLSQFGSGVPSPTWSSDSHQSLPVAPPHHQQQMPNLGARSTTHLPLLLKQQHHRHSTAAIPLNRRTLSTPGTDQDRSAFRKSFIGGSVVNQSGQIASLPPVPVDPKVLAKQSKKSASNLSGRSVGTGSAGGASGNASSRASIMTNATDGTDAMSTMSGVEGGVKKNKRKSWFARNPSSLALVDTLPSPSSSSSNNPNSRMNSTTTRRSTESLSATSNASTSSSRPPALSRAGSSFNTFNGSPPPPTPPIPDTLPLPPSFNDKSRKSSTHSLKNRVSGSVVNPAIRSITPSPSVAELPLPAITTSASAPPSSATSAAGGQNLAVTSVAIPATPHGSRVSKTPTTPSIYGTPLASPTNNVGAPHEGSQASKASTTNSNTYGAPTSSSPLSMSPMTSPTSASSIPLKPAASARPSALQLPTHEEHSMQPDSFPSPGTHSDSLSRNGDHLPSLPAVTMSLPPTPITESGPGGPERNALAPAAIIKASPSSPPALGTSLAALANEERASLHVYSPNQTPTSATVGTGRARISPAGAAAMSQRSRSNSRPNTPIDVQQRDTSLQATEMNSSDPPSLTPRTRSSSKGSLGQRSPPFVSPPASRKASNNSLRATLRQAPPSPEPSSAIIEHMPPGSPEMDDQFLPIAQPDALPTLPRRSAASGLPPAVTPALVLDNDNSAAPPHQPELDMSLSSFNPRKAFPVATGRNDASMIVNPLPRKSSAQSVVPESVPLPESPALLQDGFANAQSMQGQMLSPQPRGSTPQSHSVPDKTDNAKQMKARASSPNLQNAAQQTAHPGSKVAANTQSLPPNPKIIKGPNTPGRKSSKSPFSLFKRTRAKTLGDSSPSPSEAAASQLYAPAPPMPIQGRALNTAGPPSKPTSDQMTPAPTPQLSFSSSTTSTIAGSEPSDQFYADFAPDSRPTFSTHPSSASSGGNNAVSATEDREATLKKSAPASAKALPRPPQYHQLPQKVTKMPLNGDSKSQGGHTRSKGTFSRMFGTSTKRKT